MSHPDLIAAHLEDEEAVATVNLSGEDALVITPTRSLLYESEGILSDESVTEFSHDVTGVAVSDGRRKTTVELTYPIDGEKQLRVPKNRRDTALHYILAGVFHAKGITRSGESVQSVFQFNELTLIVTSDRVLTHVGSLVWDDEYEQYPFADFTGLDFEEGNIATEIVLYVDGRSQRVKVPKGRAEEVKQSLQDALMAYFDVDTMDAFDDAVGTNGGADGAAGDSAFTFDDAVRPLGAETDERDEPADVDLDSWPYELDESAGAPSIDVEQVARVIEDLEDQINEQRRVLDAQEAALAELADVLSEE